MQHTTPRYTRWTQRPVHGAPTRTVRLALRAGKQGTGRELGAVEVWPDSAKSWEMADPIMTRIESDATAEGYTVLAPDDEV